jgi:hypothetical protein
MHCCGLLRAVLRVVADACRFEFILELLDQRDAILAAAIDNLQKYHLLAQKL